MGMYTELRGVVVFKSQVLAKAFAYGKHESVDWNHWKVMYELTQSDEVKDFINYSRSTWIPNGDVRKQDGCVVQFHTELKNYDKTIQKFLELLPVIADNWMLEEKYEELFHWTLHRKNKESCFVNGDNTHEMDYPFNKQPYEVYPDFDVFDLSNL